MLPQIRRQALVAFRKQRSEAREELIQEVVANCYRAWVLLVRRGKESVAYATPLAQFAIRQVRDGRRVGGRQNAQDIMSPSASRLHGFTVERLDQRDPQTGIWNEQLVEDRRAGPAKRRRLVWIWPPGCARCRSEIARSRRRCRWGRRLVMWPSDSG